MRIKTVVNAVFELPVPPIHADFESWYAQLTSMSVQEEGFQGVQQR